MKYILVVGALVGVAIHVGCAAATAFSPFTPPQRARASSDAASGESSTLIMSPSKDQQSPVRFTGSLDELSRNIFTTDSYSPRQLLEAGEATTDARAKAALLGTALYRSTVRRGDWVSKGVALLSPEEVNQIQSIPGVIAVRDMLEQTQKISRSQKGTKRVAAFQRLSQDIFTQQVAAQVKTQLATVADELSSPPVRPRGGSGALLDDAASAGSSSGRSTPAGSGAPGDSRRSSISSTNGVVGSRRPSLTDEDEVQHADDADARLGAAQGNPGPQLKLGVTTTPEISQASVSVPDSAAGVSETPRSYGQAGALAIPPALLAAMWGWLLASRQGRGVLRPIKKLFTRQGRASLTPQARHEAIEDLIALLGLNIAGGLSAGYGVYKAHQTYQHNKRLRSKPGVALSVG